MDPAAQPGAAIPSTTASDTAAATPRLLGGAAGVTTTSSERSASPAVATEEVRLEDCLIRDHPDDEGKLSPSKGRAVSITEGGGRYPPDNTSVSSAPPRSAMDDRPLLIDSSEDRKSNHSTNSGRGAAYGSVTPAGNSPQPSAQSSPPPSLSTANGAPNLTQLLQKYPYTVAIVNPLSGERSAAEFVYHGLCDDLGVSRVIKLDAELFRNPQPLQKLIQSAVRRDGQRGTVVVSGGDGTVAFVMSQVDAVAEQYQVDQLDVREGDVATPRARAREGPPSSEDSQQQKSSDERSGSQGESAAVMMPAVAVLALGTGNDFSNCMGFGLGYTKHKLCCMCVCCVNHVHTQLEAVLSARATPFDRWVATITPQDTASTSMPRNVVFMNYFSLGMDAFIAAHFDQLRKKFPGCFQHRFQNKGWYGGLGLYGWAKCERLNPQIPKLSLLRSSSLATAEQQRQREEFLGGQVKSPLGVFESSTDQAAYVSTVLPPKTKALIISNVNSYSGGTVLWNPKAVGNKYCLTPTPSKVHINDKLLEVQAVGGLVDFSMLQLHVGGGADKIAQTRECRIVVGSRGLKTLSPAIPAQADGEPLGTLTEPVTISIRLYDKQIHVRCANVSVIRQSVPLGASVAEIAREL